jgi:CRISPR-associated protein Cas2
LKPRVRSRRESEVNCSFLFLLCYDVSDDRRRDRLARCLQEYGERVQESVFELSVPRVRLDEAIRRARHLIDARSDSLRVYRLCRVCSTKITEYGVPFSAPSSYLG